MNERWFGPKHPEDYRQEMSWLRGDLIGNGVIKPQTKTERYIGRPLPPNYEIECAECSWRGPVSETISDEQTLTPLIQQRMETTQTIGKDIYCPHCGQFIISCLKDEDFE